MMTSSAVYPLLATMMAMTNLPTVQQSLAENPFDGSVYAFRGRRSGLIKLIWHDGIGLCMLTKRLEQGQFQWPSTSTTGRIALTSAQLAALLDGCEWRAPAARQRPELAG